ncbi:MAG: cytosine permease [Erysipelotrichales bacterium]
MSDKKKSAIDFDKFVTSEVPQEDRQSWISVMFIWMGTMVCLPSILLGQSLVSGLGFGLAILSGLVGYLVIILITALQGSQSSDLGRPAVVLARKSFGSGLANILFSFVIAIALIGWFGVQTGVAASALQQLFEIFNVSIPLKLASIIMGVVVLISALYGFKVLENISKYTVPLLIIVFLWAFFNALQGADLNAVVSYQPSETMSFIDGVVIVIGSFVLGAVIAGDYTRFNKNRKDTIKAAFIGIVPVGMLLLFIGVFLTIVSINNGVNNPDIVTVINQNIPFPIISSLVLLVATWKTNVANAYSAGIAVVNGLNLKDSDRAKMTAVTGVIGTVLAVIGISTHFQLFLTLLTNLIIPIAGVMIADYWVLHKGKVEGYMEKEPNQGKAIASYLVGAVLGIISTFKPDFIANIPTLANALPILSIIVPFILYIFIMKIKR